jgi:hypothetical protein
MTERSPYRYDSLDVRFIREIATTDVAPIIDELSSDFMGINIQRGTFRIAAGGPGMAEAAVALVIGLTSAGFLSELGKDIYRNLGKLLWTLYAKWKEPMTPSGLFEPLSVILGRNGAGIYFIYGVDLTEEQFLVALHTMGQTAEQVTNLPDDSVFPWWIEFRFDTEAGVWSSVQEEAAGAPAHPEPVEGPALPPD